MSTNIIQDRKSYLDFVIKFIGGLERKASIRKMTNNPLAAAYYENEIVKYQEVKARLVQEIAYLESVIAIEVAQYKGCEIVLTLPSSNGKWNASLEVPVEYLYGTDGYSRLPRKIESTAKSALAAAKKVSRAYSEMVANRKWEAN